MTRPTDKGDTMDKRKMKEIMFYGGIGLSGTGMTMLIVKMFMVLGWLGGLGLLFTALGTTAFFNSEL